MKKTAMRGRYAFVFLTAMFTLLSIVRAAPVLALADETTGSGGSTDPTEVIPDGSTYRVGTPEELLWIAESASAGNSFADCTILLTDDIDLSDTTWSSIGFNLNNCFAGTFDGQDHVVRGIVQNGFIDSGNIVNAPKHVAGLFGVCRGAVIRHLIVEVSSLNLSNESGYVQSYASIDGTNIYAGVVCGYARDTSFSNVVVRSSTVSCSTGGESGHAYAGGVVGYASACTFAHCVNEGASVIATTTSIAGGSSYAGGLVGELAGVGTIRQSCSFATVQGQATTSDACLGGIVGRTTASDDTLSMIRDCYNTGSIKQNSQQMEHAYVGGVVGYSSSTVNRCYNAGTVTSTSGGYFVDAHVGGIAGSGIVSSGVSNCVSIGRLSGGSCLQVAGAGTKENNVAAMGVSGNADATTTVASTSLNGADVYRETLGWDFSEVWEARESSYPVLRWLDAEEESDMLAVDQAIMAANIVLTTGDTYEHVTGDVQLVGGGGDVSLAWSASNSSVIALEGNVGHVNRQELDYLVKVTALATKGAHSATKIFRLKVLGTSSSLPEPSDVGLDPEQARRFVSLMRGVSLKNVSPDDSEVLVLSGKNFNEEDVKSTTADVMNFLEVPVENSFLRQKMGDVVQLIKSGSDNEANALISQMTGISYVGMNAETGAVTVDTEGAIKALIKVDENALRFSSTVADVYGIGKSIIQHEQNENAFYELAEQGKMVESVFNCYLKHTSDDPAGYSGGSFGCGKALGVFKNTDEAISLIRAASDTARNGVSSYLRQYVALRSQYESPDDPILQTLLDAYAATSPIRVDLLQEFAESFYLINNKLNPSVGDVYKVTIKCPVDVYLYDQSGQSMGRVVNNTVDGSIQDGVLITLGGEGGDEKTLHLERGMSYSMQLVGTGEGTMSIDMSVADESVGRVYTYAGIGLSEGRTMAFDISYDKLADADKPTILEVVDGVADTPVKCEQSEERGYTLSTASYVVVGESCVQSFAGGIVEEGYVRPGSDLLERVHVAQGYRLEGLYADDGLANRLDSDVMPDAPLTLYAKFVPDDTEPVFVVQPVGGEYYVGDEIAPLSVLVDGPGTLRYQWYRFDTSGGKEQAEALDGQQRSSLALDASEEELAWYFVRVTYSRGGETASVDSEAVCVTIRQRTELGSGTCGTDLTWRVTLDGELQIRGEGAMSFTEGATPWAPYAASVTSITVDVGVTQLVQNAFEGCNGLESMEMPFVGLSREATGAQGVLGALFGPASDAGVVQYYAVEGTTLHGGRFAIPDSLSRITLTDATRIPLGAFCGCAQLTSLVLNEGVRTIERYSMRGCVGLAELAIPSSVTNIEEYALQGCDGLRHLTIPFVGAEANASDSPESVLGFVFGRTSTGTTQYYCENDGRLSGYIYSIPASLRAIVVCNATQIPLGAFYNCSGLETIVLNGEVATIGAYAFEGCDALAEIRYRGTSEAWAQIEKQRTGNSVLFSDPSIVVFVTDDGSDDPSAGDEPIDLRVSPDSVELYAGDEAQLTVTYDAANVTDSTISWQSSDASVASVDGGGKVFAVSEGVACISATNSKGGTGYCQVTVRHRHVALEPARENEVPPTCTEPGAYDSVTRCGVCGEAMESKNEQIDALGHDYVATVVEPTWEDGGYTLHKCSRCGDEYQSDETEPLKTVAQRAADSVIELIEALPIVCDLTLDDLGLVENASLAYESLTEAQKELVTNYEDLRMAKERLSELLQESANGEDIAAARVVSDIIAALPGSEMIDYGDAAAVADARAAYEALTATQKALVENYHALEVAEAYLSDLAEVADVVDAIAALPDCNSITLDDEDAVSAATISYNALNEWQRNRVGNYATLQAAETRIGNLRDDEAAQVVSKVLAALPDSDGITLSDEHVRAVLDARAAYDALTDSQRSLVNNLSRLEEAERMIAQLDASKNLSDAIVSIASDVYTGIQHSPRITVKLCGRMLVQRTDYEVEYRRNERLTKDLASAGNVKVVLRGCGRYVGECNAIYRILPADMSHVSVSVKSSHSYSGSAVLPKPNVRFGNTSLCEGVDYTLAYRDNVNAGTATITVTGMGNYAGARSATFLISKAANGMAARASKKTVKLAKVSRRKQTVAPLKVTGAQGRLSFANASTSKKAKRLKVNRKTGRITVPKGTQRGTYKVKVRVTAAGDANHEPATKTVTCKVVVK